MTEKENDHDSTPVAAELFPEHLRKLLEVPTRAPLTGRQCASIVQTWLDADFLDFKTYRAKCHLELFVSPETAETFADRDIAFGRLASLLVQDPELPSAVRDAIEYCIRFELGEPRETYALAQDDPLTEESSFAPETLDALLGKRNYPQWTLEFEDGESIEVQGTKSSWARLDLMHLISVAHEKFPKVLKRSLVLLAREVW